jgi:hypothetical protein
MVIRPFETRPDDGGLELHDDGEGEMVDGLSSSTYICRRHERIEGDEEKLRHRNRQLMHLTLAVDNLEGKYMHW